MPLVQLIETVVLKLVLQGDKVGFLFEGYGSLCRTTYGNTFSSVSVLHILQKQVVEFNVC